MTPASLLADCEKSGVLVELTDGVLKLKGQPNAVQLAASWLRPFKADLVQYLSRLASNDPAPVSVERPVTHGHDLNRAAPASSVSSARVALFSDRGLSQADSISLVRRLMLRDQQDDERRVCLECAYLSGTVTARRCGQWRVTGRTGPPTPADLVDILQRCPGFVARLQIKVKGDLT